MVKITLKIVALLTSIGFVSLFIAYRSGYFNKKEREKLTFNSPLVNKDTSLNKVDTLTVTEINGVKKDSLITVSYEPIDFKFADIDIKSLLKNINSPNDTVPIDLPDSLFLLNDSLILSNNSIANRDSFELQLKDFIINTWYRKSANIPSTKSMVVSRGDDFVQLKNMKFKYKKTINVANISSFKFFQKPIKHNFDFDTIPISREELKRIYGSKSGAILSPIDFKVDTPKKNTDTFFKTNIDSTSKHNNEYRLMGSKSALIIQPKDVLIKEKPKVKKIEVPNFFKRN